MERAVEDSRKVEFITLPTQDRCSAWQQRGLRGPSAWECQRGRGCDRTGGEDEAVTAGVTVVPSARARRAQRSPVERVLIRQRVASASQTRTVNRLCHSMEFGASDPRLSVGPAVASADSSSCQWRSVSSQEQVSAVSSLRKELTSLTKNKASSRLKLHSTWQGSKPDLGLSGLCNVWVN